MLAYLICEQYILIHIFCNVSKINIHPLSVFPQNCLNCFRESFYTVYTSCHSTTIFIANFDWLIRMLKTEHKVLIAALANLAVRKLFVISFLILWTIFLSKCTIILERAYFYKKMHWWKLLLFFLRFFLNSIHNIWSTIHCIMNEELL